MFYRNLFAALLAVAAVGVKGSPVNYGDKIGMVTFFVGKNYNCIDYPCIAYVPGHEECHEFYGQFNQSIHSVKMGV